VLATMKERRFYTCSLVLEGKRARETFARVRVNARSGWRRHEFLFSTKAPDSRKRDWDEKSSRRLLSSLRITYVGGKAVYVTSPTFLRVYVAHLPIHYICGCAGDFTQWISKSLGEHENLSQTFV